MKTLVKNPREFNKFTDLEYEEKEPISYAKTKYMYRL
jgi:hypothetical protein